MNIRQRMIDEIHQNWQYRTYPFSDVKLKKSERTGECMSPCPTCKKLVETVYDASENLEVCSICGTVLSENLIATESAFQPGSKIHVPQSVLKPYDVVYLTSILHYYNLSGFLEEAKMIVTKLRETTYLRVPEYVYGAVVYVLGRKHSKPIRFQQLSVSRSSLGL